MIVLTGLWKHTDKHGKTYLRGKINNVDVLILPASKKSDKSPDYNLCIAPPMAGSEGGKKDKDDNVPF